VAPFAIRITSLDALFDPYSAEPLERRPLQQKVRDRILSAWIDTREERPSHLSVELPAEDRRDGLAESVEAAIRNDFETMYEQSTRFQVFTRSQRREAAVAFLFLIACLFASTLVDRVTENDAFFTSVSQGLVVLGWVAMWQPAQQVFQAVSRQLSRGRYRELSEVPIEISWI
jgi:hypothetical protein